VFPDEPNVNPKLLAMDNITLLPHMGTETRDTQRKVSATVTGHRLRVGVRGDR
jgi:glyoxylate reductase